MRKADTPIVHFHRLIEEARPPQRADRSAIGTLPTRAFRYCEAVRSATGFGWWVFPPTDLRILWDGHDIFWHHATLHDWLPLQPSAQFPWFADRFDASAPETLKGCSPPFLTALPEPGTLQIWTGLMVRTAPDWSLLVRAPANLPCPGGHVAFEDRGKGSHRWLVAGHDGDDAADVAPLEVEAHAIVGCLAADQRVTHLRRAIALAVGDAAREVGRDDPHREIGADDPAPQLGLDRLDLRRHARVTDAVTHVADDSPGGAVNLVRVLFLDPRRRDRLRILSRLPHLRAAHRQSFEFRVRTAADVTRAWRSARRGICHAAHLRVVGDLVGPRTGRGSRRPKDGHLRHAQTNRASELIPILPAGGVPALVAVPLIM